MHKDWGDDRRTSKCGSMENNKRNKKKDDVYWKNAISNGRRKITKYVITPKDLSYS